jgi:hypothetical protein
MILNPSLAAFHLTKTYHGSRITGHLPRELLCGHPKQGIHGKQNQLLTPLVEVGFTDSLDQEELATLRLLKSLAINRRQASSPHDVSDSIFLNESGSISQSWTGTVTD